MKRPDGPSVRHGVFAWMAVAVALALAVGAAYGFWSTTAQSDLLYLASLLESDQRVAVDTVHKYAAATSAIVADGVCRGDVLAAGLTVVLADLDTRNAAADYDGWSAAMVAADRYLTHAVTCQPTNGNIWARLAMVRQAEAENPDELAHLMDRSAWYAPAERGVITARCVVWRKAADRTLELARQSLDHDLLTVLTYFSATDATDCLRQAGPKLQSIVAEDAKAIAGDRLRLLRRGGIDWLDAPPEPERDRLSPLAVLPPAT